MQDFFGLNLWMFFLIGLFGFLLCYLRYKFFMWVIPIMGLVCILFLFNLRDLDWQVKMRFEFSTWIYIGLSMLFALVLPFVGALIDFKKQYRKRAFLP